MLIYFDTEFSDLNRQLGPIKLISAGFVSESGHEMYFELNDSYKRSDCSTFVIDTVLPALDLATHGVTSAFAAAALQAWLEGFGEPVTLATDSPGYDWSLIADLLKSNRCWPMNLANLPQHVDYSNVETGIENYFSYQPLAIRHHALWDARALAAARKSATEAFMAVFATTDLSEKPVAWRNDGDTDADVAARQQYLDTITRGFRPR